jgi:hypothetical protein
MILILTLLLKTAHDGWWQPRQLLVNWISTWMVPLFIPQR